MEVVFALCMGIPSNMQCALCGIPATAQHSVAHHSSCTMLMLCDAMSAMLYHGASHYATLCLTLPWCTAGLYMSNAQQAQQAQQA